MAIRFNINKRKAVEAIVWILQNGEDNVYNAMKILFAADKYSLNKYGCPVTGDKYVAMLFGTVPSWTYGATKCEGLGFSRKGFTLRLDKGRKFDSSPFSESDEEALQHGFKEYAGKSFKTVMSKNHREKAWLKAVERGQGSKVSDILFEDMIDRKQWLIEDLQETGHLMVI